MTRLLKQLRPACICLLFMVAICGILYTGVMTGLSQLLFPYQANGSIITATNSDGTKTAQGSALIAQAFTNRAYFIGRPMTVTNLSPYADKQAALVDERIQWWHTLDPNNTSDIPMDLVTASGSGVDPHISPEAAEYQIARVATERNLSEATVRDIVTTCTTGRLLGFIGEPTVNVLKANLALDGYK